MILPTRCNEYCVKIYGTRRLLACDDDDVDIVKGTPEESTLMYCPLAQDDRNERGNSFVYVFGPQSSQRLVQCVLVKTYFSGNGNCSGFMYSFCNPGQKGPSKYNEDCADNDRSLLLRNDEIAPDWSDDEKGSNG